MAHCGDVLNYIKAAIDAHGGAIDFSQFMQHALHAPGLGYYSAGAHKFGQAGDFVTAPEISPLFGRCLARQCQQVLSQLSAGEILEVGAGSGKLARDVLLQLKALDGLPERYLILESSADLRQRQQTLLRQALPDDFARIVWLDRLPDADFSGVVIANELLDAFGVHRLEKRAGEWRELGVSYRADGLQWCYLDGDSQACHQLRQRLEGTAASLDEGYQTEVNLTADAWLRSLAAGLDRALVVLIDYGYSRAQYYHPQRHRGTLRCHYRHRAHDDPFLYPGLQDITAHVEFTAIAESALACGLDVLGYTTQAYFLMACGLLEFLNDDADVRQVERLEMARQVKLLTLPAEMGEAFKVIALGHNIEADLLGFRLCDQRARL